MDTFTYGNGTTVKYGYDHLNRQTSTTINNVLRYNMLYDGLSRLLQVEDILLGRKVKYEYDILNRAVGERLINTATNKVYADLKIRYDDTKNRVAGYDVNIEGISKATDFVYGGNGLDPDIISSVKHNNTTKLSYAYDSLNRLKTRTLATDIGYTTEYTYIAGRTKGSETDNSALTTTLVKTVKNGNDTLQYAYDKLGNITSVTHSDGSVESYTYDNLNQLISVTDIYSCLWEYTYDNGGNITSIKLNQQPFATYTYGDSEWKDLLTAYNGQTITYDNIGNPLTYYNGMSFTWADGRKLASITKGANNYSYTYDSNGLRTSKTVNGVTTEYYWLNGILQGQKTGSEYIVFLHDESGSAYGFLLKNGTTEEYYYYLFNAQGDVIGIVDSTGVKVVDYKYTIWGEATYITGTLADTIGQKNPIRYRGYYYDAETGFYYVSSRYYDPGIGRFINADGQLNTEYLLGSNIFAYCLNNPIMLCDCNGACPHNGNVVEVYNKNCFFCNPFAKTYDIITGSFEAGIKSSLELATYAHKTAIKPNNIATGVYLKSVRSNLNKLNYASEIADDAFSNLAYAGVAIEVEFGIYENYRNGKNLRKIAWDATVDTAILSTNVYVSMTVGAAIGSAIPVPVIGTIIGIAGGFVCGVVLDTLSSFPRQRIKSLIK